MSGVSDSPAGPVTRTGILGGSFDPPHIGHAIVAQDLFERLGLDRLIVVPAARPPHRDVILPAETRLALVRKLFDGVPGIEVSDVELGRPGPSFTIDTLRQLVEASASDRFVLVMGADQLAVIDTWKDFEELGRLARIAVMRRDGGEPAPPPGVHEIDYIVVDVTRVDVSASRIRRRLDEGRTIRFLVPEAIRQDIERAWAQHAPAQRNPASSGC